jgi:hypothetical protein
MRLGTLFALFAVAFAGCGSKPDEGPTRYQVSGQVTFDGKPVPTGTITFVTTSGPSGSAQITDGKYDTRTGKGVVGGPHQVMIEGFDGKGTELGAVGNPIFNPYRIEADLPQEDTTKDFVVPASASKDMVISNDPA